MSAQAQIQSARYDAEISGWDREQSFFVEKTTLEWYENVARIVYVRHPVTSGAVIFVRLVDPTSELNTFPIAYQAESVSAPDVSGLRKVFLQQLQPRAAMPSHRRGAVFAYHEEVT
jgi:hypothetical protein